MRTRWQELYQGSMETVAIAPSATAVYAAARFSSTGARRVLDVGCGTGRDTIYLIEQGFSVVAVDAAHSGLALARRRPALRDARLVEADARVLPLPSVSFDAVYCFGLLHEFVGDTANRDVGQVLDEISRVLVPGGMLVLAVLAGDPEAGLPYLRMFSEEMLRLATCHFLTLDLDHLDDLGCTGRPDYSVWRGTYVRPLPALPPPTTLSASRSSAATIPRSGY